MKNYVIDTNVLIQAPNALWAFQENRIVIPLVVVEELDHLKKAEGEKGANARKVIRCLEQLRHQGDLLKGVRIGQEGILQIEKNFVYVELPEELPDDRADNRILQVCVGMREKEKDPVIDFVPEMLVDEARDLLRDLGIPQHLADVGVTEDKIELMAADAMKSGNIMANPRQSTIKDIIALYKKAM